MVAAAGRTEVGPLTARVWGRALRTAFALMVVGVGSAHAQSLGVSSLAGCYDLTLVEPQGWANPPGDSAHYRPPPRIELRASSGERAHPIAVPEGSVPSPHSGSWSLLGDTLQLAWSTGFVGLTARVIPDRAGFSGVATTFSDAGGGAPGPHAVLEGVAVDCASATPFPVSSMRRLWIREELEGLGVVVLGEPLPDAVVRQLQGDADLAALALGLARGADEVVLRASGEGRLIGLRARFRSTPVESLRDRAALLLGPWDHESRALTPGWYWLGRLEHTSVTGSGSGSTLLSTLVRSGR